MQNDPKCFWPSRAKSRMPNSDGSEMDHQGPFLAPRPKMKICRMFPFLARLVVKSWHVFFRQATVFALPSLSEGVPKVSQEAAACGLAQVIFGYYQSPTVVDGKNGLVVYDDDSFISAVERLVNDADLSRSMGERGALMSQLWNWDSVAPKWESAICQTIRSSLGD